MALDSFEPPELEWSFELSTLPLGSTVENLASF